MKTIFFRSFVFLSVIATMMACGGKSTESKDVKSEDAVPEVVEPDPLAGLSIGVGPITEIKLEAINNEMALAGKEKFDAICVACHKIDTKFIGPPLTGVTKRRRPEWIMNMALDPEKMVVEDDTARALLGKFIVPMTNQNLTEEDARAILEYFRQVDASL